MGRGTKWSNVQGTVNREITLVRFDGTTETEWRDENDRTMPPTTSVELSLLLGNGSITETVELEISFNSSGYTDPGRIYGPPEDCYPPEGEDEREVDGVTAGGHDLSKRAAAELASLYEKEIADVEIDTTPDYDY